MLPRLHTSIGVDELPRPWHFATPPSGENVFKLMRDVRSACRAASELGQDWRSVIDGLRRHTQRIWSEMSLTERRLFLRHLRSWWNVHRHRSASRVMARILEAIQRLS